MKSRDSSAFKKKTSKFVQTVPKYTDSLASIIEKSTTIALKEEEEKKNSKHSKLILHVKVKVFCTGKFLVFILYNGKGGGRKDPFIANICIFAVLDDSQY